MALPRMYYDDARPEAYLELHVFDGTVRGVMFKDDEAKAAALAEGRAAIDCTAIEYGFLPRGAVLVSRASAGDAARLLEELRDSGDASAPDALAAIRLSFSLGLLVAGSEYIDEERDAEARRIDPTAARRYESIVDALRDADAADVADDT